MSLEDFASFALAFPGVSRADARLLHPHRRDLVCVTVAGDGGLPFAPEDPQMDRLRRAILDHVWAPTRHQVETYTVRWIRLELTITTNARQPDPVLSTVRFALLEHFGTQQAPIGRDVAAQDVIDVVTSVEAVTGATLRWFAEAGSLPGVLDRISAQGPRWDPARRTIGAAEIAALDPHQLQLRAEMQS
ncbi:MAG: hypothetical protein OEY23_25580 [Acidimicrobiia bacterium]|nr:hypothetical protein [Acidimicrobiia bacterium]